VCQNKTDPKNQLQLPVDNNLSLGLHLDPVVECLAEKMKSAMKRSMRESEEKEEARAHKRARIPKKALKASASPKENSK
jgi:hypothetical protein